MADSTNDHGLPSLPSNGGAANSNSRYSSSPELSSPPRSLSDPGSPGPQLHNESSIVVTGVPAPPGVTEKPAKRKYVRKVPRKSEVDGVASPANAEAPKVKKPRKPKDPNAPPRKPRAKKSDVFPGAPLGTSALATLPSDTTNNMTIAHPAQYGNVEDIPRVSFFSQLSQSQVQPQVASSQQHLQQQPMAAAHMQARTSGQNFDPIRSISHDTLASHNIFNNSQSSSTQSPYNRASASPSISSLVNPSIQQADPPKGQSASSFFNVASQNTPSSMPASPTTTQLKPSPLMNTVLLNGQTAAMSSSEIPTGNLDESHARATASIPPQKANGRQPLPSAPDPGHVNKKQSLKVVPQSKSTASSSTAASPKQIQAIDISPPPLPGSGLMRGPNDGTESRAPTIILHIPLKGEPNTYVNFTRLAEERYGWDALHPRLAAQRERLARVAAAGAALEKIGSQKESGDGDEMSLDISEGEASNVEMGGMSDGRTGTDGGKKVTKKRKTKEDDYDKLDGFVDDSEMLWEEHAAASKDGFFVYSGPLVPEGEKPQLERAEPVKRGRGGRGGRGGSRGGAASTRGGGTTATSTGTGTRGSGTVRKPRVTKADRARMELEKAEREKQGLLATPPGSYNTMMQNNAAMKGGTPIVFNS